MTRTKRSCATFFWLSSITVTVLSSAFLMGCVSLDKPENVKKCASSPQGCSDYPTPKSDASDGHKATPDARLEDAAGTGDVLPELPDSSPDRFSSPDAGDATIRQDAAPVAMDGGPVDADPFDSPLDLPSSDASSLDEGVELDLGSSDGPSPDITENVDTLVDLASPDLGFDVASPDTPPDAEVNCVAQIASTGYKAGSAPPCSECRDNGLSLATKCQVMIDCLASKPAPRSSTVFQDCLNVASGSAPVSACATALVRAGCPNGY